MPPRYLSVGDEVAVLPSVLSPASDTLEICQIMFATTVYIQLVDGRMFATIGGKSLLTRNVMAIVPATDEHREILALKKRLTAEDDLQ